MSTNVHGPNALKAWGADIPDWVRQLAARCDAIGLKRAAAQVGYSSSAISAAINNKYRPTEKIELRVRATLMAESRPCPELGEVSLAQCLEWQERASDFQPVSSQRRRMLNACMQCAFHTQKGA